MYSLSLAPNCGKSSRQMTRSTARSTKYSTWLSSKALQRQVKSVARSHSGRRTRMIPIPPDDSIIGKQSRASEGADGGTAVAGGVAGDGDGRRVAAGVSP